VLKAVTLDVFEAEPLNPASRLWRHPAVTISPHNAADTDPDTISSYVAGQILQFEAGGTPRTLSIEPADIESQDDRAVSFSVETICSKPNAARTG
jgi:phosphoglycerate dehydrogenase-like enzyme